MVLYPSQTHIERCKVQLGLCAVVYNGLECQSCREAGPALSLRGQSPRRGDGFHLVGNSD